jgi:DNA-binding transcriptional LysR family regulator
MRGNEYADLTAFIAVVEHGSFARAAEHLRVSRSALSQIIRGLEERLGLRLLNRTTRSVSLTDAGLRLHARLVPAVMALEAAIEDVNVLRDKPAGTLRVCFTRLAATLFLEPILGRFHAAYPDIALDITLDDALTDIVAGRFDVGVRMGDLLEKDMVAVRLGGNLGQLVVASPSYIAKHGKPDTPADLHDHQCINWRQPGSSKLNNWTFQKNGEWFSVAVNGPLVVSDRPLAMAAAIQGIGLALTAAPRARPFIASGALVPLLEEWCVSYVGWHLFYPKQRHVPATVRVFVDFIRKHSTGVDTR